MFLYYFVLFGHNSLKWDRRIEPLRYTEAKKNYAEAIELVAASTCNYFFNLASAQSDVVTANNNYANADTLYRMAQGRYKIGTITENEMLQLEIRRLSEENGNEDRGRTVTFTRQVCSPSNPFQPKCG